MSDERPDALLKSALEKIVYFEARAASLSSDLSTAKGELERLRTELTVAAQREIELRREVAELEVRLAREHAEREQQARAMEALRAERSTLVGRIIEASRIHDAERSAEPGSLFDLAGFMSELRSEAFRNHAPRAQPSAASAAAPVAAQQAVHPATVEAALPAAVAQAAVHAAAPRPTSTVAHAQQFAAQGRLTVTEEEVLSLSGATFTGRTEETLFGFSVRELSAPDASSRFRAAERLKALAHPAAAPALAAALNAEGEPRVLVALLDAFSGLAKAEGTPLVQRHLTAVNPDVRVAALKALLRLAPVDAIPQLSAALKDPDRAVRRRASLLALNVGGVPALELGEQALHDADADVRALGALVLGAAAGERSRQLLLRALGDRDEKVRKAAAQGLSRILGEDVSAVVGLDEAQRRRELRRIAGMPERPVRAPLAPRPSAVTVPAAEQAAAASASQVAAAVAAPGAAVPVATSPEAAVAVPHAAARVAAAQGPATVAASQVAAPVAAPAAAAQLLTPVAAPVSPAPSVAAAALRPPAAPVAPHITEAECEAVLSEVRMSIRGKAPTDIAKGTGLPPEVVDEACALLVARGHAVRRGLKVYVA